MSLQKIRLYLYELEKDSRSRLPKISEGIANLKNELDYREAEAEKLKNELEDVGFLRNLLFKTAKEKFQQYTSIKAITYGLRTQLESYAYAELLLAEIISRLNEMYRMVVRLDNFLRQAEG